jgi:hypothetical protein
MLDVLNDDAFSNVELTASINILEYKPRLLGSRNWFTKKFPTLNTIYIERRGETLSILETKPRGSGETNKKKARRRDMIPFMIPHIPHDDSVYASDVAGVREFGYEEQLERVTTVVNDKLLGMRNNHEVTHEYHRIGALKGIILDGDAAASELLDLFEAFGITQEEHYFELDGDGTALKRECLDVIAYMEDILGGETYDYVHALCGNAFFQDLVNNQEVKTNYSEQTNYKFPTVQQGTGTQGRGTNQVWYGDILFENYRGKVGSRSFVETDEAHFFPVGVNDLFQVHFGPAETMSDVNTPGKELYAQKELKKWDEGMELHSESNPLHICRRPKLLVKGYSGAEES